jgi:hypothetical protein
MSTYCGHYDYGYLPSSARWDGWTLTIISLERDQLFLVSAQPTCPKSPSRMDRVERRAKTSGNLRA